MQSVCSTVNTCSEELVCVCVFRLRCEYLHTSLPFLSVIHSCSDEKYGIGYCLYTFGILMLSSKLVKITSQIFAVGIQNILIQFWMSPETFLFYCYPQIQY